MTLIRSLWLPAALMAATFGADLPVREVILYKHGVGYFERAGELKAGETARLDFKAGDMNDVLKSLTITGEKVVGVRYDASETLEKRLEDFPFAVGEEASLAKFLDQMKGARLELKLGSEAVDGVIVSARLIPASGNTASRETVLLLIDSGEIRAVRSGRGERREADRSEAARLAERLSGGAEPGPLEGPAQYLYRFAGRGGAADCGSLHDARSGVEVQLSIDVRAGSSTDA